MLYRMQTVIFWHEQCLGRFGTTTQIIQLFNFQHFSSQQYAEKNFPVRKAVSDLGITFFMCIVDLTRVLNFDLKCSSMTLLSKVFIPPEIRNVFILTNESIFQKFQ